MALYEPSHHAKSRRSFPAMLSIRFASLARALGDFDLAEDAMQDAFADALVQWPIDGRPTNPVSWLVSTERFKAIDRIRQATMLGERAGDVAKRLDAISKSNENASTFLPQPFFLRGL